MDPSYLERWNTSLAQGFDASKRSLPSTDENSWYDFAKNAAKGFVYSTLPVKESNSWYAFVKRNLSKVTGKVNLSSVKSFFGSGVDKTKEAVLTGYMVIKSVDLEAMKSSSLSGYDATKNFVYGVVVLNDKSVETAKGIFKGANMFNYLQGNNLIMKITQSNQVNILDKATKNWIFRLDKPHKGYNYNHLNINTKFSGLRRDPHLALPPGSLQVS